MKVHYSTKEEVNESDNNVYWAEKTACGLHETEAPLDNNWDYVTCKRCLKVKSNEVKDYPASWSVNFTLPERTEDEWETIIFSLNEDLFHMDDVEVEAAKIKKQYLKAYPFLNKDYINKL